METKIMQKLHRTVGQLFEEIIRGKLSIKNVCTLNKHCLFINGRPWRLQLSHGLKTKMKEIWKINHTGEYNISTMIGNCTTLQDGLTVNLIRPD